jgi:hypothetical protein
MRQRLFVCVSAVLNHLRRNRLRAGFSILLLTSVELG